MRGTLTVGCTFGAVLLSTLGACRADRTSAPAARAHRAVAPRCSAPAPLFGTYSLPGYIVQFRDTIDAAAETARLAQLYGFTPLYVYQSAPRGFAADLSDSTVAAIRCEASVQLVEYNQLVTVALRASP